MAQDEPAVADADVDAPLTFIQDLEQRLTKLYTGDEYVVEAMGTGLGKPVAPRDSDQTYKYVTKSKLVVALTERLRNYYTGHLQKHTVQAFGQVGRVITTTSVGSGSNSNGGETKEEQPEGCCQEDDDDDDSVLSMDSVTSVQSMIVAATMMQTATAHQHQLQVQQQQQQQQAAPQLPTLDDHFEQHRKPLAQQAHFDSAEALPVDDDDENGQQQEEQKTAYSEEASSYWEEYTVADESRVSASPGWDEITVETTRSQAIARLRASHGGGGMATPQQQQHYHEEDAEWDEMTIETQPHHMFPAANHMDDDGWDEYTVETIAEALMSLPYQQQQRLVQQQQQDEGSIWEETTLASHLQGEGMAYSYEEDDNWDDYTVETVADAFVGLPRQLQLEFLASAANHHDDDDEDDISACSSQVFREKVDRHGGWSNIPCQYNPADVAATPNKNGINAGVNGVSENNPASNKMQPPPLKKPDVTDRTMSSTDSESSDTTLLVYFKGASTAATNSTAATEPHRTSQQHAQSAAEQPSTPLATTEPTDILQNLDRLLKEDMFSSEPVVCQALTILTAAVADTGAHDRAARIVDAGGLVSVVRSMEIAL